MVIDLDKCSSCGACIVACRTENNVPVVGARESELGRAIFWMELVPLLEGEFPDLKIQLYPRPCMQCSHPPCVKVCPVGATYKSEETGIVGQIYRRCIGCRYCVNNCPYSVRYFNWHSPEWIKPLDRSLNPDVSVRTKGVVERCTFCHHRLQKAREQARTENRELHEHDYIPACVEICPSKALYFGDLSNQDHRVSKLVRSTRAFRLLEELGTEPNVIYLSKGESYV
ncbi:MAG: 4Fe-4S dicluster domain-containing protein [bacterium]|nr:MAG: 4Fe-4S dicluster domain-containing protein [bacterium]